MNIENTDGDEDGEGDKQHGEEEILPKQGDSKRCWRNDLGEQQEEHSQWKKNRYAQRDLKKEKENR